MDQIWTKLSEECFLVESTPPRINAVLKVKGVQPGKQGVPSKVAGKRMLRNANNRITMWEKVTIFRNPNKRRTDR